MNQKLRQLTTLFFLILIFTTCQKRIDLATIKTLTIIEIGSVSAIGGGNIENDGGGEINSRGIIWSTEENPSLENYIGLKNEGKGIGLFQSALTNLTPATSYYVRAYAINEAGIAYGAQMNFTTEAGFPPSVSTAPISNITINTSISGGNILSIGSTIVTQKGVCWSTIPNPTLEDSHTIDGAGMGSFTSQITGLIAANYYYVRAYAINGGGVGYGNQVQFKTLGLTASLTTNVIENITNTSATGGGNITSEGSTPVIKRGVCWSTSPNPTIADKHTNDGIGIGIYRSQILGLLPGTLYFVRAYASNADGTSYGVQESFTTTGVSPCAGITPPSGYGIVFSSGKCWLDRNLGAERVAQSIKDAQAYGDLYQWGRRLDGHEKRTSGTVDITSSSDIPGHGYFIIINSSPFDWRSPQNNDLWQNTNDFSNPCPTGFRLPTFADWETERQSWSSNDALGAFNSPLKLTLAGRRDSYNGFLIGVGSYGDYWSSTTDGAFARNLFFYTPNAYSSSNYRGEGRAIRCLKD